MGVGGADELPRNPPSGKDVVIGWLLIFEVETGNASQVDVTRRDLSTARKYFPRSL